jgi:hypothetical protein
MQVRLAVSAVVLSVGLAACTDRPSPTSPPRSPLAAAPLFAISDGAHSGGNPNFFFLPPLVGNPVNNPNFKSGTFDPHVLPVVRVFLLPAQAPAGCNLADAPIYGPVAATLDPGGEQYQHNWNTKASNLAVGASYRICVFSSPQGQELGFLDVAPVTGGMKKLATGDTYAFQDDRTMPIKVRIQQGALCAVGTNTTECKASTVIGAAPGTAGDTTVTIVVPSGHAALSIPPGAIKPGDTVTFVIEKQAPPDTINGTPQCLPTDLKQSKGCYHASSAPDLYKFATPVAMEVCVDVSSLSESDTARMQLYKFNKTEGLQALPRVEAPHINCEGFIAMANPAARPSNLAAAALHQLGRWAGRLFGPAPLYAAWFGLPPKGIGGGGGSLSDFGGAVPPPYRLSFGQQPTNVSAGSAISPAVTVTVRDSLGRTDAASTASITLAITSGTGAPGATLGGTLTQAAVNGVASFADLTIDKAAGQAYTLTATSQPLLSATSNGFVVNPGPATQIAVNAGNNQSATAGTAVAAAPSVIVRDANSNPVAGVSVTFAVATGGGTVVPTAVVTTNASGIAQTVSWTLGTTLGTNTLTATSGTLTGSPVTITATGTPGAATQMMVNAGNNQSATVGTAVTTAPSVLVRDANNNPVSGVSVTFAVASGGGTVLPTVAVITGANGIAAVTSWMLGTTAGTNTLTATSGTLTGSPVTFTATGTPGPATKLRFTVQPSQTPVLVAISPPVQVTVQDALGNTATSVTGPITLTLANYGQGLLRGDTSVAAVNGVATFPNLHLEVPGNYALVAYGPSGLRYDTSAVFTVTCPSANDGVLCEPGWATATTFTFNVNLVGGGTVPATASVWNDATDLHLALKLPYTGTESTLTFSFDNNNVGYAQAGDDIILLNPPNQLIDDFLLSCPGTGCYGHFDTSYGGNNDGSGAVHSDGSFTVYEMSHPLNSGDIGHDFTLAPGQTVGMFIEVQLANWPAYARTDWPCYQYTCGLGLQVTIK